MSVCAYECVCSCAWTLKWRLVQIGVDFAIKQIQMNSTMIRLQLWDIAGQERFGNMTRVFYRDAVAAVVVYDKLRPITFEASVV